MKFRICLLIAFFSLFLQETKGQICNGALGDPVIFINFSSGIEQFGPSLSASNTNYTYTAGTPNDGSYTITNTTNGMHKDPGKGWHQIYNHTGGTDGYMMVVNASNNPGIFYQTIVNNLCPNTTYEFASWIINLLDYPGIKPNITFEILDMQGNLLSNPYNTGNINETTTPTWKQYGLIFKTPANVSSIILRMTNNGSGGIGNDIALDDITFRPCGPVITPSINNGSTTVNLCEGATGTFILSADVSSGYADPVFQWQYRNGNIWVDIPNETNKQTTIQLTNAKAFNNQYRLVVAERQNAGTMNCSIYSSTLSINVAEKPSVSAPSNVPICVGTTLILTATGGTNYSWTGPKGFSSNLKNPTLPNIDYSDAGTYKVTVSTDGGCSNTAESIVQVLPLPIATTNVGDTIICQGQSVQLQGSGGAKYSWFPTTGLSNPNIANPLATPSETTIYSLTVANGTCNSIAKVKINVTQNANAFAGEDKTILAKESVRLDGKVTGDSVNYFWTPVDYLDDPTKLNPIASPPTDITYTLHAKSNSGCASSTDEVFIKVYDKVFIPNSFSPNGDGVNDFWNIPILGTIPTSHVKVVNRYGEIVFEGGSSVKPWDGKWKGKEVPVGTYYYTLHLSADFDVYKGWVFITR